LSVNALKRAGITARSRFEYSGCKRGIAHHGVYSTVHFIGTSLEAGSALSGTADNILEIVDLCR